MVKAIAYKRIVKDVNNIIVVFKKISYIDTICNNTQEIWIPNYNICINSKGFIFKSDGPLLEIKEIDEDENNHDYLIETKSTSRTEEIDVPEDYVKRMIEIVDLDLTNEQIIAQYKNEVLKEVFPIWFKTAIDRATIVMNRYKRNNHDCDSNY